MCWSSPSGTLDVLMQAVGPVVATVAASVVVLVHLSSADRYMRSSFIPPPRATVILDKASASSLSVAANRLGHQYQPSPRRPGCVQPDTGPPCPASPSRPCAPSPMHLGTSPDLVMRRAVRSIAHTSIASHSSIRRGKCIKASPNLHDKKSYMRKKRASATNHLDDGV